MTSWKYAGMAGIGLGMLLALSGCAQSGEAPVDSAQSAASPDREAVTVVSASVHAGATAGTDPTADGNSLMALNTGDPIEVRLQLSSTPARGKLEAKLIRLDNGEILGARQRDLENLKANEVTVVFSQEAPWPTGRHLLEVSLDGQLQLQRDIDIAPEEG